MFGSEDIYGAKDIVDNNPAYGLCLGAMAVGLTITAERHLSRRMGKSLGVEGFDGHNLPSHSSGSVRV